MTDSQSDSTYEERARALDAIVGPADVSESERKRPFPRGDVRDPVGRRFFKADSGLGGWLVLFVLGQLASTYVNGHAAYNNFAVAARTHRVYESLAPSVLTDLHFQGTVAATLLTTSLVGLYFIFTRDARTRKYWIAVLWVAAAAFALQIIVDQDMASTLARLHARANTVSAFGVGVRGTINCVLWALYWMRSSRVRETFAAPGQSRAPASRVTLIAAIAILISALLVTAGMRTRTRAVSADDSYAAVTTVEIETPSGPGAVRSRGRNSLHENHAC